VSDAVSLKTWWSGTQLNRRRQPFQGWLHFSLTFADSIASHFLFRSLLHPKRTHLLHAFQTTQCIHNTSLRSGTNCWYISRVCLLARVSSVPAHPSHRRQPSLPWTMRCTYSLADPFANFSSTIVLLLTVFIVGFAIRFEPVVAYLL
jgi:hypothetical protein